MTLTVVTDAGVPPKLLGGVAAGYGLSAASVITTGPAVACALTCQASGTITLNDSATTGGASITNQIISVTMTEGQKPIVLNWPCLLGLTASSITGGGVFSISFT